MTAIERENRASTVVVEIDQWRKDIAEERALKAEDRQLAADEKRIAAEIIDLQAKRAERQAHDAAKGQVDDIRPLKSSADQSRDFSTPETPREAVQTPEASAASTAPGQPATRTVEPQRAAEAANSPRSVEPEKNYSKRQGDELDNAAAQPVGFFGRIAGWFQNWWNMGGASSAAVTAKEQAQQNAGLAGYFDEAARNRVLDGIRHDDAERREWQQLDLAQQEKDERLRDLSLAERFGHNATHESSLGPVLDSSDDEIKAAKKARLAQSREEIEQGIEKREREPDRGYELE